ncbi:MAG: hypothetical protein RL135_1796 [Bacteroidota bacterium]
MIRASIKISLQLLMFLFVLNTSGQCIDPLNISPGFPCPDPTYRPVCGCDGITYRHDCDARYRNGVQTWSDGPCSGFEFDLIPTFVTDFDILRLTFVQNTGKPATLYLLDYFGKIMIQRTLPASDNFAAPFQFDLPEINSMRPGPYIVIIFNSQGTYRYKKFVKV